MESQIDQNSLILYPSNDLSLREPILDLKSLIVCDCGLDDGWSVPDDLLVYDHNNYIRDVSKKI